MLIPRTIIQTAKSFSALPDDMKRNVETIRAMNPDWEHRFFDDEALREYLRANLSAEDWSLVQTVNPKYGVVLADLFRYVIMLREGGVYLDVKSTVSRPLSEIIPPDAQFLISQWPNKLGQRYEGFGLDQEVERVPGGEFQQWCIVAAPGHAFLKAALKLVLHNFKIYAPARFGHGPAGVFRVSGPIAYTNAIYPLLDDHPHHVVEFESIGIHYSIYQPTGGRQRHQTKEGGHYSFMKEPIILKGSYSENSSSVTVRLGYMLAREVREHTDLVLKLALFSFVSTCTALAVFLILIGALAFSR